MDLPVVTVKQSHQPDDTDNIGNAWEGNQRDNPNPNTNPRRIRQSEVDLGFLFGFDKGRFSLKHWGSHYEWWGCPAISLVWFKRWGFSGSKFGSSASSIWAPRRHLLNCKSYFLTSLWTPRSTHLEIIDPTILVLGFLSRHRSFC